MRSSSFVAVSCLNGLAAAFAKGGLTATLKEDSHAARRCIKCERLEAEFIEARDRLRTLTRLRRLTALEEKQLIDRVAVAIARIKEHEARHERDRSKKGLADK